MSLRSAMETPVPALFWGRAEDWAMSYDWPLQLQLFDTSVYYVNPDDDDWWDD